MNFRLCWALVFLMACGAWLIGCPEPEPEGSPTLSKVVLLDKEKEAVEAKVQLDKAMKKKVRPVAVGGCREQCPDHLTSFRNYLEALRTEGPDATVPFLESTEMVHDGERLGDVWVQEWKDGALKKRTESIRSFAQRVGGWAAKATPEALEAAMATGISVDEDDDPGYLIRFRHPSVEGDSSNPVWTYRIQKRGWEWLISEIRTRAP